jgi:hypothetical protein
MTRAPASTPANTPTNFAAKGRKGRIGGRSEPDVDGSCSSHCFDHEREEFFPDAIAPMYGVHRETNYFPCAAISCAVPDDLHVTDALPVCVLTKVGRHRPIRMGFLPQI